MLVRCPNCSHPIELVRDVELEDVSCPSCGSRFSLLGSDEPTATLRITDEITALRQFNLIEKEGSGQFGQVWKAHDTELDRLVAIKLPHRDRQTPGEAAFFLREARSNAQLNHPNIVTVYEVGREGNRVFIVSEFIEGLTLREWMNQYPLDAKAVAELTAKIARALDHAHQHGVIHRDLKPSNIMLDGTGQPHVMDFGLAKREGAELTIAATGQVLGTPAYMSPEQTRHGGNAEARSDVYSLGVIMYELLTGKRPFVGGKRVLMHQILYDDPRPPRSAKKDVPKDLETICLKAMAKRPAERFTSAGEMADDLERFVRGEPIRARRLPVLVRATRWSRRRPAAVAAFVLSVAVLALLALLLRPTGRQLSPAARTVKLTTDPPGAEVVFVPLDARAGTPRPERAFAAGKSPIEVRCEPGQYLVVASMNDRLFHEVYRHVPRKEEKLTGVYPHLAWRAKDGIVSLPTVKLFKTQDVTVDMVRVQGGTFRMSSVDLATNVQVRVPDFYLDVTEVTIDRVRGAQLSLPHRFRPPYPAGDFPVVLVSWDEAVAYAEKLGKRLVRDAEFQYVATEGGSVTTGKPWMNNGAPMPGPVMGDAYDRLAWPRITGIVVGIRSNVLEWTADWWAGAGHGQFGRVVRGGYRLKAAGEETTPQLFDNPPPRQVSQRPIGSQRVGFRCARSARPRLTPADFVELMTK